MGGGIGGGGGEQRGGIGGDDCIIIHLTLKALLIWDQVEGDTVYRAVHAFFALPCTPLTATNTLPIMSILRRVVILHIT